MDNLGLTLVTEQNGNCLVDIIFVHGLGGDSHTSWMSDSDNEITFWPTWLGEDFEDAAIWTYGYSADISAWKDNSMPLPDSGLKFLEDLHVEDIGKKPIIFITHSMGGLLIKHLLVNGLGQGVDRYKKIVEQVAGVAFLATPHSGANLANFANFTRLILRTNEQVSELELHNSRLVQLHGHFLNFVANYDVICRSYCETKEIRPKYLGIKFPKGMIVVDRASAEPSIPKERAIPLESDHISICKPESRNDAIYKYIKSFLLEALSKIEKKKLNLELCKAETQCVVEGLQSPTEWFKQWNETLAKPQQPPHHWLLKSIFIEGSVYKPMLESILNGGRVAGISGFLGMGGVGKTYTALKISWELINQHDYQVIWASLLQQSPDEALDQIVSRFQLIFVDNLSTNEKVVAIKHLFKVASTQFKKLLIVLDNAENFTRLDLLLEALRDIPILVTSRQQEYAHIIDYKRIVPLQGKQALDYCSQLLVKSGEKVNNSDVKDLTSLCSFLGGHPLAIRLSLSGFLNKPRVHRAKINRFNVLLNDLKKKGLVELSYASDIPLADTPDERILHVNIQSTFEWTYSDLCLDVSGVSKHGAYLLLPIMSVLGTASVSIDVIQEGLKYIKQNISDDLDNQIITSLNWLLKKDENIESSISDLIELSLVEINEDEYAVHPLIREFAIQNREVSQLDQEEFIDGPSSNLLYRMAIAVLLGGSSVNNDALIDIFPRLKKNQHIAETAIYAIFKSYNAMYYQQSSSNLSNLEKLLTAALELAEYLTITDEIIWLSLKLGELRFRLEKADGLSLIDKGLNLFIQEKTNNRFTPNKKGLIDYMFSGYLGNNSFTSKFNKDAILWASCFVLKGNSEIFINHAMNLVRLLSSCGNKGCSLRITSEISEYISSNIIQSASACTAAIGSSFISNVLEDLENYISFKVFQEVEIADKKKVKKIISIIKDNYLRNKVYVYSIEKILSLYTELEISLFLSNKIDKEKFIHNMNKIKINTLKEGFRGYYVEARYQLALSEKHLENSEYKKSLDLLDKAYNAIIPVEEYQKEILNKIQLLKLLCLSLSGYETDFLTKELLVISNSKIKQQGIYYLVLASFETGNPSKRAEYSEIAVQTFIQMYGGVPRYARPLLAKWKSWSGITKKLTGLPSWLIDYNALPEKVISIKDGKVMCLVQPGIQWTQEGKEIWIWPFYMDEKPMSKKEVELYASELKHQVLERTLSDDSSISVSSYTAYKMAKRTNKSLPSKQEAFAAYLQFEHKIMPEIWNDIDSLLEGMLKRIEYSVKLGETISIPCSDGANHQQLTDGITEKQGSNVLLSQKLGGLDIKSFYSSEWLSNNISLKDSYRSSFLKCFRELYSIEKDVQDKLSALLVTSLSLDYSEKKRVLNAAKSNTLSQFQCDELIKTFEQEKIKFYDLAREHPDDIKKLIKKCTSEFFSLINVLDISESIDPWHIYVSEQAHTNYWLNEKNQEPSIGSISLENKNTESTLPALRFVKPIFTKIDMEGLEEINLTNKGH